jgi:hypothetical protein
VLHSKGLSYLVVFVAALIPTAVLSALFAACGGENICLGCGPSPTASGSTTVTIQGTVVSSDIGEVGPFPVYICADDEVTDDPSTCQFQTTTNSLTGAFTRSNVSPGSQQIFFANQSITQEGALVAKLQDPDGLLDEVEGGFTVTLDNVQIEFEDDVATADITVTENPTPTPSPTGSPTPAPTL